MLSEIPLAASDVVHFADYRLQQVGDSDGQQDQRPRVLSRIERRRDEILKNWTPLVVSILALIFSILSFIWSYKALQAASLANRWAYYTYQLTLIADRLSLMQLCAMNMVCRPPSLFLVTVNTDPGGALDNICANLREVGHVGLPARCLRYTPPWRWRKEQLSIR